MLRHCDVILILWKQSNQVICCLEVELLGRPLETLLDWYCAEYEVERDKVTYIFCPYMLRTDDVPSDFDSQTALFFKG